MGPLRTAFQGKKMSLHATPELFWLCAVSALTGLLWVPYILQLILQLGPIAALWDPVAAHPHNAAWALRAKRAHANAVENLVVIAPLAFMVHIFGVGDGLTAMAMATYFGARIVHYLAFLFAIPLVRTLAFLAGFCCQAILGLRLFGLA